MGFGDSHALQGSHQRLQRPIGDQISQPIAKKKDAGTSHMLLKLSKTRSHFARRTNKVINSELEPDQNIITVQREVNRTKKKAKRTENEERTRRRVPPSRCSESVCQWLVSFRLFTAENDTLASLSIGFSYSTRRT